MAFKEFRVSLRIDAKNFPAVKAELAGLATTVKGLGGQMGVGTTALQKFSEGAQRVREKVEQLNSSLGMLQRLAGGGLAAIGAGLALLSREGLKVSATFEDLGLSLETLLKSKEKADALMREVVKFTATTPFELKDVGAATQQMLAFGESLADIPRLLKTIGQASAIMKVPFDQAIRAYESLRQGLIDRVQLGAIGISTEDLIKKGIKFNSQGSLESSAREAADALLAVMEERFGGAFDKVNQTLSGKISNAKDSVTLLLKSFGDGLSAGAKDALQGFIDVVNELLGDAGARGALERGGKALMAAVQPLVERGKGMLSGLVDLLRENPDALVQALNRLLAIAKDLAAALIILTGARALLGLITLLTTVAGLVGGGPAGIIAGAVAGVGLIALFAKLRGELDKLLPSLGGASEGLRGIVTASDLAAGAQQRLQREFGITKSETQGLIEKLAELNSLQAENAKVAADRGTMQSLGYQLAYRGKPGEGRVPLNVGSPTGPVEWFDASQLSTLPTDKKLFFQGLPVTAIGNEVDYEWQFPVPPGQILPTPLRMPVLRGAPAYGYSLYEALGMYRQGLEYERPGAADYAGNEEAILRKQRQLQYWSATKGFPGELAPSAADPEALAKHRAGLTGAMVELLGGISAEDANAVARAQIGRLDNTCAAATRAYLEHIGFKGLPQFRSTQDVVDWAKSVGAQGVSPGDVQPGDLVFKKDLTDTLRGGGPNGLFDHVGIATAAAANGLITFKDNSANSRTKGLDYFGAAYRLPTPLIEGALRSYSGEAATVVTAEQRTAVGRAADALGRLADWAHAATAVNLAASARRLEQGFDRAVAAAQANLQFPDLNRSIEIALAQQRGESRYADALAIRGMYDDLNELFAQLTPENRVETQGQIAEALRGVIEFNTGVKERDAGMFAASKPEQDALVERYIREFGPDALRTPAQTLGWAADKQSSAADKLAGAAGKLDSAADRLGNAGAASGWADSPAQQRTGIFGPARDNVAGAFARAKGKTGLRSSSSADCPDGG